jgi:4-amino-4-deoxy-L-arabinose transferase-like glycosyltransferase
MALPRPQVPRFELPPSGAVLVAIALAFVLPGLAGHDPWKAHDAIGIGIVHGMAATGDGILPRVAGVPWLNDPPLYHWVALVFGKLLGGLLEFHAAARIASGVFVLAALWLIHAAAREWSHVDDRPTIAASALLILLGSVGLMVHAHEAVPELAALAALCGALAALPHARTRAPLAGALFGAALGCAYLSGNWIAPTALGLAVFGAHLACDEWRTRKGAVFLGTALLVCIVLGGSWPLALRLRSPEMFDAWWTLASHPQGAALANLRYFLAAGLWFAWPAWPLAFWTLWSLRGRLGEPRLFVPTVASAAILGCIGWWGPAQSVNLIPLLAPLSLLAAQGVPSVRRGAAAALDWFGVVTFAFFASLVWLGYVAMMTGVPPRMAGNFSRGAPGFMPQFELLPLLLALVLTLGWLYIVLFTTPSPGRAVTRWAAGIVLLWGTFAMLWMPWADYQKSYRSVALQLRSKIPVGTPCVAQKSLGIPQAAALDYHAGIRTRPFDVHKPDACPLLIVQGSPKHEFDAPGTGWIKIADVGRPGDKLERQRLYRFAAGPRGAKGTK